MSNLALDQTVSQLKSELEYKTEQLKILKREKVSLEKLRNLSDLKIIHKTIYDELEGNEKLIDKLISLKTSTIDLLNSKIEKLEKSKKIEASLYKMFADQNEQKRKMLEKYVEHYKITSSLENPEKLTKIVESLRMVKPVYEEYEALEEQYKKKLAELQELQTKKPRQTEENRTSTYFLVFFICVLVVNILVGLDFQ